MATRSKKDASVAYPVAPDENDDELWDNVVEESPSRVIFDTVGDRFSGLYVGEEEIDPGTGDNDIFTLYLFRKNGELFAINKSYKLAQAMDKIEPGSHVRITYVKDIATNRRDEYGNAVNPLKDFRVDVRK